MQKILVRDEDGAVGPVSAHVGRRSSPGGGPALQHPAHLQRAVRRHHWEDADRVTQLITETIPARVAADSAFRNARQNSDRQNARSEHDMALLLRVMTA